TVPRRRNGRLFFLKRRKVISEQVANIANVFLAATDAPITVLGDPRDWQRWEIDSFQLLHGGEFRARPIGQRAVLEPKLPGQNTRKILARGRLRPRVLQAAGRELRRAHQLVSNELNGAWSHGDLHLGNVIYDETNDRARLIDFEIMHKKSLSTASRHADDLLAFLQDMVNRVTSQQWVPFALEFLNAYNRPKVLAKLELLLAT